jgi:acyl-coenzyme A synthetase/AMP-(fatty) acid ligase
MNVVEPVLFQCDVNPHALAICVPGSSVDHVNYGTLGVSIHNVTRAVITRGLKPGNVVGIFVQDIIFHAILVLACMRLGIVPVAGRPEAMPKGVRMDAILTDRPDQFTAATNVISFDQGWTIGENTRFDYDSFHQVDQGDLCAIVLTSGSTGEPKAIGFTHGTLARRTSSYLYSKGPQFLNGTRLFCDLGLATSPGFRYLLLMLWRGGTVYYLGEDPSAILQMLDLHQIDIMSTSPYGLSQFVQYFERDSVFECSFQSIVTQGAMLTAELAKRVQARMCQNLYCTYGSTEVGTVARAPANILAELPGAVGFVEPGVRLQVIDESGSVLPAGREGMIRVHSPSIVNGYVGDPETSGRVFREGFFYPGDLGYVTANRMLVISGRAKTVLNLGGLSIKPETIEAVVSDFPGVQQAAVFSMTNELGVDEPWALIVGQPGLSATALRDHCQGKLEGLCVPKHFIAVDVIPRNEQGKIQRHRLADIARAKRAS